MKVILPCCGRSSRFPNQPPKWMLPAHDGQPPAKVLAVQVDLLPLLPASQNWQIGANAVLEHPHQHFTYWALSHPGPQPDFHLREGFIITL